MELWLLSEGQGQSPSFGLAVLRQGCWAGAALSFIRMRAADASPSTALPAAWDQQCLLLSAHKGPLFSMAGAETIPLSPKQKQQCPHCLGKDCFQSVGFNRLPSPPNF